MFSDVRGVPGVKLGGCWGFVTGAAAALSGTTPGRFDFMNSRYCKTFSLAIGQPIGGTGWLILLLSFLFLLVQLIPAEESEVTVVGQAKTETGQRRREVALAAALRQAVRLRTGQDVAADPEDLGRVFVDTLAFVRSYRPRRQEITADGGYRLEIVAQVDDQPAALSDAELFDKLLARRPAPRVRLRFLGAEGEAEVLPSNELVAEIHELMRAYHVLQVAPREPVAPRPTIDPVTGVAVPAESLPWTELDPAYDFGLDVRVIAAVQDPNRPAHEAPVLPKVELDLVWALTAERVGQASLPSTEVRRQSFITGNPKRESVERYARQDLLEARRQEAVCFCRDLLARWITECDLGTPVHLEFTEADSLALGDLVRALRRHPEIGHVTEPKMERERTIIPFATPKFWTMR